MITTETHCSIALLLPGLSLHCGQTEDTQRVRRLISPR
ncbi:rCG59974 [Rattus norvegicus]|uniref:RCG59974 n=1 Tax=Rattus norvegicus TaxID=10116 RepID=A6HR32_RAT|nr:rCG59974 [Rattus norvegicus]